jgi:hypothetical protein
MNPTKTWVFPTCHGSAFQTALRLPVGTKVPNPHDLGEPNVHANAPTCIANCGNGSMEICSIRRKQVRVVQLRWVPFVSTTPYQHRLTNTALPMSLQCQCAGLSFAPRRLSIVDPETPHRLVPDSKLQLHRQRHPKIRLPPRQPDAARNRIASNVQAPAWPNAPIHQSRLRDH